MTPERVKSIIESLLFISTKPLSIKQIRNKIPEVQPALIKEALDDLCNEYKARNGGFYLAEVANGYQFRTPPENKEWLIKTTAETPRSMSKASLETLTIIAYKQPVIRSDIEHIRGVDSGGPIKNLLNMKMIKVFGRKNIPGRPLIYATTPYFLEFFNLKSIDDLPSLNDIEALDKPGDFS